MKPGRGDSRSSPGLDPAIRFGAGLKMVDAAIVGSLDMTAGARESEEIAAFRHDFAGKRMLFSYAAEPAAETRGGDRLAQHLYGLSTRSPHTPYICVWRDTAWHGTGAGGAGPPSEILMACSFGTSAWTPPRSLIEEASERIRRDEAVLRVKWVGEDGRYRMTRLEVELRDSASMTDFRSSNFGEEVEALAFAEAEIAFPASASDRLAFRISASVPRRQNPGEAARDPIVALTAVGSAVPIPLWLLY